MNGTEVFAMEIKKENPVFPQEGYKLTEDKGYRLKKKKVSYMTSQLW